MAKKAVLTEYRLTVPQLRQPLTIAHVSDLHERDATDILALLQTVQPDLIAVTGDSFCRRSVRSVQTPREPAGAGERAAVYGAGGRDRAGVCQLGQP